MTATFVLPSLDKVSYPWPTQLDIEVGDFCLQAPVAPFTLSGLTAQNLYPASSMPHQASTADDQRLFAALFAGVSKQRHLATDLGSSAPTNENTHDVVPVAILDVTCAAAAFKIGDLLGLAENGGNTGLLSQQVVGVTDETLAIGRSLTDSAGGNVTTVRGLFVSKVSPPGVLGGLPLGRLRETIAFGSITGASTTGTYTFTGKIPAGAVVLGYRMNVTATLTGTGPLTAATMELGWSGHLTAFSAETAHDVFTATGAQGSLSTAAGPQVTADTQPVATFALTGGNANALTAGNIVLELVYLPPLLV